MWVGTGDGLGFPENEQFRLYGNPEEPLGELVWAIQEDRNGTLWFATDHGLERLAAGRTTRYSGWVAVDLDAGQ